MSTGRSSLSLAELKAMPGAEIVAVNQCSGNSRGFFEPRVAGGQLANGAMGNARWTGVPLKAVLDRAGVKAGAVQVVFEGLDGPVLPETPDFAKALGIDHARDGEVMLAWAMNGEDLPWLNGYPAAPRGAGLLRHLLGQAPQRDHGARQALRGLLDDARPTASRTMPAPASSPARPAKATVPIGRFNVRSFVTNLADGAAIPAGRHGACAASPSTAARASGRWRSPPMTGRAGPRRASARISGAIRSGPGPCRSTCPRGRTPSGSGRRASDGATQPMEPRWNPPGYMRNVVETVRVRAA